MLVCLGIAWGVGPGARPVIQNEIHLHLLLQPNTIRVCNLFSVVGPAAKLHVTVLLVEGEPLHVDLAAGLVDGGRGPLHVPGELELSLGHQPHLVLTISAEDRLVLQIIKNAKF